MPDPVDLDAIRERVGCPSAVQAVRIGEYEACARVIVEHDARALLAEVERLRATTADLAVAAEVARERGEEIARLRAEVTGALDTPRKLAGPETRADMLRRVLAENGVGPATDGLHSWRCAYPDRYGTCDCLDRLVADLVRATDTAPLTASLRALVELWRGVAIAADAVGGGGDYTSAALRRAADDLAKILDGTP